MALNLLKLVFIASANLVIINTFLSPDDNEPIP